MQTQWQQDELFAEVDEGRLKPHAMTAKILDGQLDVILTNWLSDPYRHYVSLGLQSEVAAVRRQVEALRALVREKGGEQ